MIKRILVAVDGSECSNKAFDYAALLAKTVGSELYAVHIVQLPFPAPELDSNPTVAAQIYRQIEMGGESLLLDYYKMAKEKYDLDTKTILARGYPPEDILEEAEEKHADLVVMGSKGLGGFKRLLLGSVSNAVVQHSKIPVLIVK